MRTTISLDDAVLQKLKKRAAETGQSVSRLVEQAVRLFILAPAAEAHPPRFQLITFGRGGRFSNRNIDKTSSLLEIDDRERFGPRR